MNCQFLNCIYIYILLQCLLNILLFSPEDSSILLQPFFNEERSLKNHLQGKYIIAGWLLGESTIGTWNEHDNDGIWGAMASQITSLTIVYSTVDSGADQRKHQSSASLAFVRWIHRFPVNSPHRGPVTSFNVKTPSCVTHIIVFTKRLRLLCTNSFKMHGLINNWRCMSHTAATICISLKHL